MELVEASDPEGRAFAWILFAAQDPAGYVTTNQIWIPEADMVRFLVGERVVLPDEDDRQEPLGYGTRSEGANGHPIDVLRWRGVSSRPSGHRGRSTTNGIGRFVCSAYSRQWSL